MCCIDFTTGVWVRGRAGLPPPPDPLCPLKNDGWKQKLDKSFRHTGDLEEAKASRNCREDQMFALGICAPLANTNGLCMSDSLSTENRDVLA